MKLHFILLLFFFNLRFNRAIISRLGATFRHRNLQSVIGLLNLEAEFNLIFFFNFRFNRAIISRSGAMYRHGNFQSVIGSLTLEIAFNLI